MNRPVSETAGTVTAFRDGEVVLRSERRMEGFTESLLDIGYQGVEVGDLVVHSMDGFAGAIGVSRSSGKMSPVVHVYTPVADLDLRFVQYYLRHLASAGYVQSLAKGIRERSTSFDPATLADVPLPLPPTEEQRRIADFLDDQVARIDKAMWLRQEQVRLERAAFEAWLNVTVGLLPRIPLRRQMVSVTSGPRGWGDLVADSGRRMFIRINNISGLGIDPNLESVARVDPPEDAEAERAQLKTDDLLVSITASIGDVALAGPDLEGAAFSQHVARVRLADPRTARAVAWAATATALRGELINSAAGGTKIGLGLQQVADWRVPVFGEKAAAFAIACDERHGVAADILMRLEGVGKMLSEYKRSLITAAVTGEFDVTTARVGVPA